MEYSQGKQKNRNSASILCLGLGWFPKAPGGLERYVYDLTHQLAAHQDRVELCGLGLPDETNLPIKLTNLAAPDSPILQRLYSVRQNFKKTRSVKPDAINLHFALYSFPIMDLLPKGVPITFNFHGPWGSESQQEGVDKITAFLKQQLIEKTIYNRCDRFIVLSKAFGNILHQNYQITWSKIHVIPGGVDITRFQPNLSPQEARRKLSWAERPTIFTSRRLVNRTGVDKLLQALAILKPKIADIMLTIAGRGPLQKLLEQQAEELGLTNHVRFLGFISDEELPIAYQAADLTVMPSQSFEGFGLAIVESLACGTPVVCTPVGGMPEILQPFCPDLITSSIAAPAIAQKLEAAMLKKILVPSRQDCRQYAVDNFDWCKVAQDVRSVILA